MRKLPDGETVELVCEGLDTLSEIKINGVSVAKTSDMHRTYRFPVKKYLKQGENTIEICFFSVLEYIKNYEFRENSEIHYVPSGAMKGNELVRKAHSMFGWDWGPQLAGSLRVNEEKQVVELYLTNETTEKVSYHGTLCHKNFACEIQETLDVSGGLDAFSAKCVAIKARLCVRSIRESY